MAEPASLDQGAEQHPQVGQPACLAQHDDHRLIWVCQLPILHAGDHASGPIRWQR